MRERGVKTKANVMVLRPENENFARLDWLKWTIVAILVAAGLVGNHYYSDVPMAIRTLVWLAILALAGFVATLTQKGNQFVGFVKDSRAELRKVVWPTREETMQTTLVVGVMVIILALALWGVDGVLVSVIGWITGQRS